MAPGRGLPEDQRRAALPLARGRSARRGARHPGPGPAECHGRQTLLQAPAGWPEVQAPAPRHRRAEELWRRAARGAARGAAPNQSVLEQQSGKFAQADAASRAADAAVQVTGAGPALPVIPRDDLWPLPSAATPDDRGSVPARSRRGLPGVATGDGRPDRSVNTRNVVLRDQTRPSGRQLDNALQRTVSGTSGGVGQTFELIASPNRRQRAPL